MPPRPGAFAEWVRAPLDEFRCVVGLLAAGRFGTLDWLEARPLAEGAQAVEDMDAGRVAAAKIILIP